MNQTEKTAKKRVLVFTLSPPLPATAGAPVYTMNTITPLVDECEFHLFMIGGQEEVAHVERHRELYSRHFKSVHIEPRAKMPAEKTILGQFWHSAHHLFFGLPFIDASYFSFRAVKNAKKIVADNDIDLLEIHGSHLAFFKRFLPALPAILVSHNIEMDIFPFWIPVHLKGWRKLAVNFVAEASRRNAKAVEIDNKWSFEAISFISRQDLERCRADVFKVHLPLSIPVKSGSYARKRSPETNLLWMGGFWWYPNAEAAIWFATEIYPHIKDELVKKNIIIHFLGANPPQELMNLSIDQNVIVHGFVDSIEDILEKSHLLFVPLLSGAGIRVKILEAMANGIPVLSTSKGCEGLGLTDGLNIAVRDSAEEFASELIALSADFDRRQSLSTAATHFLSLHHDISAAVDIKSRLYEVASAQLTRRGKH